MTDVKAKAGGINPQAAKRKATRQADNQCYGYSRSATHALSGGDRCSPGKSASA